MAGNYWSAPVQQLFPGASVAQSNFTAAQGLPIGENTTAAPQIYGGQLNPGSLIRVEAWGVASNTGTPTLILGLVWGGTVGAAVGGTSLLISTAKTTTTAMSAWEWHAWATIRVLSTGTAGSMIASGYWRLPTSLTAWTDFRWPETAPASVGSLDTTVSKNLVISATWSAASASNSITCHSMEVIVSG